MAMRRSWAARVFLLAITCLMSGQASAVSISVYPTRITVPSSGGVELLYVVNRGTQPSAAQIQGFIWRQNSDGNHLDSSNAIVTSPPITILAPGERQMVRILVPPAVNGHEQAYRVLVSELPVTGNSPQDQRAISVLLRFSIPVFVGSPKQTHLNLSWKAIKHGNTVWVTAVNNGRRHIRLLGLVAFNGSHRLPPTGSALRYVLAGGQATWKIPAIKLAPGTVLHLEAAEPGLEKRVETTVVVAE